MNAIKNDTRPGIVLKPGREKSVVARHPWIFSGAIASAPQFQNGDVLCVYSSKNEFLGFGMCNASSQIFCRMLSFDKTPYEDALKRHILQAIELRKSLFQDKKTNAFRLINAEGDFIPGLIVDQYADTLVIQISALGIEKLKPLIIDTLVKAVAPTWIYEKSNASSRKEEGLAPVEKTLFGKEQEAVTIVEDGLQFLVSPKHGQKTGFFLDQREMRRLVGELSKGKKVLNCFSYTGGFTLHALSGKAKLVDSVDISEQAIGLVKENIALNGFQDTSHSEYAEDCFEFLKKRTLDYDLVILDPPAFAKRKSDIKQAARGYKEINLTAMKKMPPGSLLLTCSCSYHIDETLFKQILFGAAKDAHRNVQIIGRHRLAEDHPLNIYHPEGSYLKSFLCHIQ